MPLWKRLVPRLLLLSAGLVIGLLLAEGALRVLGISYPLPYFPDVYVGTRLQPGFAAWFTKEGRAFVQVNQAGFRDREHPREKPTDTLRIAVLGDSFSEAVQVAQQETFWSVMQTQLQARFPGRNVEVLNFGISGHGTGQQLLMWRHYAAQYQPDVVLLAFFPGNDVRNNSKDLESDQSRPFFDLRDGVLTLDESFLAHPDFVKAQTTVTRTKVRLINASRLLQLANEWKNRPRTPPPEAGREHGLDASCFVSPQTESWIKAWELTDTLVVQLARETKEAGAQLFVAVVTSGSQVDPDGKRARELCTRLEIADLNYPEQRIGKLAESHNFHLIRLAEPLARRARESQEFLHGFHNTRMGDGHWNAAGHQAAGEVMSQAIGDFVAETRVAD